MIFLTDGECHADIDVRGCIARFHIADIYLAMFMLVFDSILFSLFCYKWYQIMQVFKKTNSDHKVPTAAVQQFIIQFVLTICCMGSCFFDGVAHLLFHNNGYNYHITMIIFLFDCTVVATCNFCMISESQMFIAKFFCFCFMAQSNQHVQHIDLNRHKARSIARNNRDNTECRSRNSTECSGRGYPVIPPIAKIIPPHSNSIMNDHSNKSIPEINPSYNNCDEANLSSFEDIDITGYEMKAPPHLTMAPTQSNTCTRSINAKKNTMSKSRHSCSLSAEEIKQIRSEIDECVRKGSIVIVYDGKNGKKKKAETDDDHDSKVQNEQEMTEMTESRRNSGETAQHRHSSESIKSIESVQSHQL